MAEAVPRSRFERGLILALYHLFNLLDWIAPTMRWLLPLLAAAVVIRIGSGEAGLTLGALGSGALAFILVAVILEARRPVCTVLPLAVPKTLAEAGWTAEACAGRVADVLQAVATAGRSRDLPFLTDPKLPVPSVEVPGTKLTAQALIDVAAMLLGSRRIQISGEVVRMPGQDGLRVRLRGGAVMVDMAAAEQDLPEVLRAVAMSFAERVAPYNLALALVPVDAERALRITEDGARSVQAGGRQRVALANLRALLLLGAGDIERGEAAIDAAARIARPWHPMTLTLTAWRVHRDERAAPELRAWYDRLATLAAPYLATSELNTMLVLARARAAVIDIDMSRLDSVERDLEDSLGWLEQGEQKGWGRHLPGWAEQGIARAERVLGAIEAAEGSKIRQRAERLAERTAAMRARLTAARPAIEQALAEAKAVDDHLAELQPLIDAVIAEQDAKRAATLAEYRRWLEG